MIARLRAFAAFWYDFVIGDDWRVAVGVAIALALTVALSATTHLATWWIVQAAVAALLPLSIRRATQPILRQPPRPARCSICDGRNRVRFVRH
jgi:hypothetical protein